MRRCGRCGRIYDDESLNFCTGCGAYLQGPGEVPPVPGRTGMKSSTKLIAAVMVMMLVTSLVPLLLQDGGEDDSRDEGTDSLTRTNSWIFDVDMMVYTLEFEIDADDLDAALSSTIDRSGSTSYTTYTSGTGTRSKKVWAVSEYIVIGKTVIDVEAQLRDIFPSGHGPADSTNPEYATFLINFCQSSGHTGDGNMKYLLDSKTHGTEEYWNYPVETLYHMGGDCEDTSILTAALLTAAGFDSGIALLPGHAMAIIGIKPAETPPVLGSNADLKYGKGYVKEMFYGSDGYWMLETTSSSLPPGAISGDYAFSTFIIFPSDSSAVYAV